MILPDGYEVAATPEPGERIWWLGGIRGLQGQDAEWRYVGPSSDPTLGAVIESDEFGADRLDAGVVLVRRCGQ